MITSLDRFCPIKVGFVTPSIIHGIKLGNDLILSAIRVFIAVNLVVMYFRTFLMILHLVQRIRVNVNNTHVVPRVSDNKRICLFN